ncbi:MAG: DUF4012 domain-containing protein [Candidatus Daviesbacteria bacterium]|nr:DUF4012 domain-containing protein [Candidatus Daviesbacteria bacterium]
MPLVSINKKIDKLNYRGNGKKSRSKLIAVLVVAFLLILSGLLFYSGLRDLKQHGSALSTAYKNQNFDQIKTEIGGVKASLQKIDVPFNLFFFLQWVPIAGGYYGDAKNLVEAGIEELDVMQQLMNSLEPAKVELGFTGQPIAGQDRLTQGMKILDKVIPQLDSFQPGLERGANKVRSIDTNKYPADFRGIKLRLLISTAKDFIIGASDTVKNHKDVLDIAPSMLGQNGAKNYLLLFQNDKEIRPTGGFMTAYANLTLDKGQVTSTTSDDIYRLDEQLLNVCLTKICPLSPPLPIVKYLPEVDGKPRKAWSMRDSNLSPNLPTSAYEFERMYQMLGKGLPYDGIIYIDTQVVEALIEVTGPIEVYGTQYSSEIDKRCNCPNVIFELESYAEIAAKGEKDRKAVLGVLMQQILARSIGADVTKFPELVSTIVRLANHKHFMFYMHDGTFQKALSNLNWTGEIKSYDGDYLHINDANFAGGKSNIYVNQTVTQEITTNKNGQTHKKITIVYDNPQPFGNWLNGINRDYVRVYVPKGSKLTSSKGSDDPVNTTEDLDKTVFEAFVQVRPQNSRSLVLEYDVPYNPTGEYKLLIQKQPGAKDFNYKVNINGRTSTFTLDADKEFKFKI